MDVYICIRREDLLLWKRLWEWYLASFWLSLHSLTKAHWHKSQCWIAAKMKFCKIFVFPPPRKVNGGVKGSPLGWISNYLFRGFRRVSASQCCITAYLVSEALKLQMYTLGTAYSTAQPFCSHQHPEAIETTSHQSLLLPAETVLDSKVAVLLVSCWKADEWCSL